MAKTKRLTIGSIYKGKDGKQDYLKVNVDVQLKKGQFLSLESKKSQLDGLPDAVASGRLSEETAEKIRERVNKIPDYVRFEVVLRQATEE